MIDWNFFSTTTDVFKESFFSAFVGWEEFIVIFLVFLACFTRAYSRYLFQKKPNVPTLHGVPFSQTKIKKVLIFILELVLWASLAIIFGYGIFHLIKLILTVGTISEAMGGSASKADGNEPDFDGDEPDFGPPLGPDSGSRENFWYKIWRKVKSWFSKPPSSFRTAEEKGKDKVYPTEAPKPTPQASSSSSPASSSSSPASSSSSPASSSSSPSSDLSTEQAGLLNLLNKYKTDIQKVGDLQLQLDKLKVQSMKVDADRRFVSKSNFPTLDKVNREYESLQNEIKDLEKKLNLNISNLRAMDRELRANGIPMMLN